MASWARTARVTTARRSFRVLRENGVHDGLVLVNLPPEMSWNGPQHLAAGLLERFIQSREYVSQDPVAGGFGSGVVKRRVRHQHAFHVAAGGTALDLSFIHSEIRLRWIRLLCRQQAPPPSARVVPSPPRGRPHPARGQRARPGPAPEAEGCGFAFTHVPRPASTHNTPIVSSTRTASRYELRLTPSSSIISRPDGSLVPGVNRPFATSARSC